MLAPVLNADYRYCLPTRSMAPGTRPSNERIGSEDCIALLRNLNARLAAKSVARLSAVFCLAAARQRCPVEAAGRNELQHLLDIAVNGLRPLARCALASLDSSLNNSSVSRADTVAKVPREALKKIGFKLVLLCLTEDYRYAPSIVGGWYFAVCKVMVYPLPHDFDLLR